MTIQGLDQVRALADPLRLRLLEAFHVERTTAQVAQLLEEKPTRLYHHVDALERAGLLRKTRTQRKRGTLEQYYLAVARRFVAAASLFATGEGDDQEVEAWEQVITSLLEGTAVELRALLAAGRGGALEGEGVLAYLQLRAGTREIAKVRRALERLVRSVESAARTATSAATGTGAKSPAGDSGSAKPAAREVSSDEERAYRLTVAFFPIETPGTRGR